MQAEDLRRLALALPEAEQRGHMGKEDFRVHNKVFATLPEPTRGVVKLTPEQQLMMCEAESAIFSPVPGGWGAKGWTSVHLEAVDEITLASALRTAWRNVAPKVLLTRA